MALRRTASKLIDATKKLARKDAPHDGRPAGELVIITGMSGSGKASVLKAFEDLGYYCVDNLPVGLIPRFAELVGQSAEIDRTALVVDVREGRQLEELPAIVKSVKRIIATRMVFLEASDSVLLRRYSETRRPHPLGTKTSVKSSLTAERRHLRQIRAIADLVIDTSKFNVHELRSHIIELFQKKEKGQKILVSFVSFGFRHGVPDDADLVFDVRFLPNPYFVEGLKPFPGNDPRVSQWVLERTQTQEFLARLESLLHFLIPQYRAEGKSYLTVSIGCTGGRHRSVALAEELGRRLTEKHRANVKITHRDVMKV